MLGDATYAGLGIGVRLKEELADAVKRDLPRVRAVTDAVEAAVRALR